MADIRLRAAWGGGEPRAWQGELKVSAGTVADMTLLGLEADESRSISQLSDRLLIQQRGDRVYAGVDFTVKADLDSNVTFELAPADKPTKVTRIDMPLRDLLLEGQHSALDERGNRVMVVRAPGDALRVDFKRDSLVFATGERFEFTVKPHHAMVAPGSATRCRIQLNRARTSETVWSDEVPVTQKEDGSFEPIEPVTRTLPNEEGAYDLVVSLTRRRFGNPLVGVKVILERRVQVLVLGDRQAAPDATAWSVVTSLDPNNPGWAQWLARMPRLPLMPDFAQQPMGSQRAVQRDYQGMKLVELGPNAWQAYPVTIAQPGRPHILEIEYPANYVQTLGISLVEPNAAGDVAPIGLDSGVDVERSLAPQANGMERHRLVFWPRTRTPLVLLTNRGGGRPAMYGKIQILSGPATLPPRTAANRPDQARLMAAYFDKPLFPENFSASEQFDPETGRCLEDWVTFYEGATRLVEYLKYAGYNGAVVSVVCEGSTLYPSALIPANPKYDNGIFFASGQDARRKDVLEMLFRLFDRADLKLVPAIHFSSPLARLEAIRQQAAGNAAGIDLVGSGGESWVDRHWPARGLGAYYNPLNSRVQDEMSAVVAEITNRYEHHTAFSGIALQLSHETYALLPGVQWGFDRQTQSQFEAYRRGQAAPPAGEPFTQWLDWRAGVLAEFYSRLQREIERRRPGSRLYLAAADLLASSEINKGFHPRLISQGDVAKTLLEFGIDAGRIQRNSNIVLFRPHRTAPVVSIADQAAAIEFGHSAEVDQYFDRGTTGSVWYREPMRLALPEFDRLNPFGAERSQTFLVSHVAPSGAANRRRLAHSLATLDAQCLLDGGWMLTLGQEQALLDVVDAYSRLPARRFTTARPADPGEAQPVVVRSLNHEGQTYVYLVNDSPWNVTVDLSIKAPQTSGFESLSQRHAQPPLRRTGQLIWNVQLEPYDLAACVVAAGDASVESWRVFVDKEVVRQLQQELFAHSARVNSLQQPQPVPVLANPGFEADKNALTGWVHGHGRDIKVIVDRSHRFEGSQSMRISNTTNNVAWVRSDPIPTPRTGRIAVLARLRIEDGAAQPALRIAVEGRQENEVYYRPANVGAGTGFQLAGDWGQKPFLYFIDDLPPSGLTDLRIGFDLVGPGEVWIDDVQVYEMYFLPNERQDLLIRSAVLHQHLGQNRVGDVYQILDSYWPRFISQFVQLDARVAARPAEPPPAPDPKNMLDRLRDRLPTKVIPWE